MTIINNDKAVAAVAAPVSARSKRKYKQREPIYETSFSFTDSNIVRAKLRTGIKNDRRYDDRIPGLSLRIGREDKITFYAWKNVPMYNRKRNTWS